MTKTKKKYRVEAEFSEVTMQREGYQDLVEIIHRDWEYYGYSMSDRAMNELLDLMALTKEKGGVEFARDMVEEI